MSRSIPVSYTHLDVYKRQSIDKALMRKGRLAAKYKFDELSLEKTNRILKELQKRNLMLASGDYPDLILTDWPTVFTNSDIMQYGVCLLYTSRCV